MKTTTTRCSEYNHPEFHIVVRGEIPADDVDWLVSGLEQSVQHGTRYTDGQLLAVGLMLVRLSMRDGCFFMEEPDLRGVPITWSSGITNSLKLLRLQKDIADSLGLGEEAEIPTIRESVIVGDDLEATNGEFVLDRLASEGADSGWFIGKLRSHLDYTDPANLHRISIYQAIVNWPRIAGFLSLPPGTHVEASSAGLMISRQGERLVPRKGSFLDLAGA